jgi:phosphoribosylaminoimidazolecarboxamide formyltransferase/IMP cyclohydrolase
MHQKALISVSDKKGIVELARGLAELKIDILSTGGTAKTLKENKISVTEVGDYTGQPEILDGRLKTLHPKIHGGILAIRGNVEHERELKESGIGTIDLVVVNLYPFEATVAKEGVLLAEAIENIDIGGPTMLRAAAKNWMDVTVIVDPLDYGQVLEELKKNKKVSKETNFRLAQKVFAHTARYDGAIANYLTGGKDHRWPDVFNYQGTKMQELRYGENPHQKAAFYRDALTPNPSPAGGEGSVSNAKQLHGKELSFNNILDLDAAIELVKEFKETACAIIKHNNPSGVAEGGRLSSVFIAARECDPLSAFGGIIGLNRKVDVETAKEIIRDFYECVVAPGFDPEAFEMLSGKKNIRLLELPGLTPSPQPAAMLASRAGARGEGAFDMKKVVGGLLIQERDLVTENIHTSKIASQRPPSAEEWQALEFAWKVCRHVKSNAIVFASRGHLNSTVGIGCGQMSRIDSTRIGISKARGSLKGAVMASDAFFPFRDSVDEAAKAGISAIIQPGGSLKDAESIAAADENKMAMVLTGIRHFRH